MSESKDRSWRQASVKSEDGKDWRTWLADTLETQRVEVDVNDEDNTGASEAA